MKPTHKLFVGAIVGVSLAVGSIAVTAPAAEAYTATSKVCTNAVRQFNDGIWGVVYYPVIWHETAEPKYTCVLSKGDGLDGITPKGLLVFVRTAVKALQNGMNTCYGSVVKASNGGDLLAVDGKFGSKTYAALIRVQRAVGTTPDGVFGVKTRDAMMWPDQAIGGTCHVVSLPH
jgi:hypothetical protein